MSRFCSILLGVLILYLLKDTSADLVKRKEWKSANGRGGSYIRGKLGRVFIHHTATPACYSKSSCSSRVRSIQNYHVKTRGWADIGYSFLVGQDGRMYEGRGWRRTGAHTYGHNSKSYGIAFIGDFRKAVPNARSRNAVKNFLDGAGGYLTRNYKLYGHKDVSSTACPGNRLYNIIKNWSRYGYRKSGVM